MFTFVESAAFDHWRSHYLDDDEYGELQQFMMQNPEGGKVVPGAGGVRKLRWGRAGAGKRGGLRVIYFVRYPTERVLDAGAIRQGEARKHPGPYFETNEGDIQT